jgi:hypothetical protein
MTNPTTIPEGHRRCQKCQGVLPLESFGRDRTRPCGRQYRCRSCDNHRRSVHRQATYWTPERLAALQDRLAGALALTQWAGAAADSGSLLGP